MNIANQGFPATRADLNNALQALVSNSSGTSAPSTTFANQWWYDTTNNKMYIRNEANNAWIEVFTLDQTNNEWQLTTGVVQAKDSDGLALKTDDGTTRLFIKDADGNIGIGTTTPGDAKLFVVDEHTTTVTDASTLLGNTTFKINGNQGQGTDQIRMGPMCSSGAYFIDVSNSTGAAAYNLAVNPFNGGTVTIGSGTEDAGYGPLQIGSTSRGVTILQMLSSTSGDCGVHFGEGTSGAARYRGYVTYTNADDTMLFGTADTTKMRISSSGILMVNTTTATGGKITTANTGLNTSNVPLETISTTTSSGSVYAATFYFGATFSGSITVNGAATAFNTSSDYRLKENVTDVTDGITRVKKLSPKRFNWIADESNTTVDGFLAHEAQTVVPEAVHGEKDAMRDEEYEVSAATGDIYTPATEEAEEVIHSSNVEKPETLEEGQQWRETTAAVMDTRSVPDYQGIDQSKLVPLLTAALQEAIAKIETLETKVAALEGA